MRANKVFRRIRRELGKANRQTAAYYHFVRNQRVSRKRFVIFGQGRTGSTLLVSLLNSNPNIHCDEEILRCQENFLNGRVWFPYAYVEGMSAKYPDVTYGFKVKIYHLIQDQHLSEPKSFLQRLSDCGWKVIYLQRRNLLRHVLSNWVAQKRGAYHHKGSQGELKTTTLKVDAEQLIKQMGDRARLCQDEQQLLDGIPHTKVVYEDDLEQPTHQQAIANRIFDYLGLPEVPVHTDLCRINRGTLADIIENYNDVNVALSGTDFEHFLVD